MHGAAVFGRKEIAELLIAKGADVNAKIDGAGLTPLHMASGSGRYEIVELLIDKGADLNAKDIVGRTMDVQRSIDIRIIAQVKNKFEKYKITHLPHKSEKCCIMEQGVLDHFLSTQSFVDQPINTLSPETFTTYKNNRLTIDKIAPSTFMRQFCIIQHVFEIGIREWGLQMQNLCRMIQKPKIDNQFD